jgi:hypothetical protein
MVIPYQVMQACSFCRVRLTNFLSIFPLPVRLYLAGDHCIALWHIKLKAANTSGYGGWVLGWVLHKIYCSFREDE